MSGFFSRLARVAAVMVAVPAFSIATAQEYKTISAQGAIDQIRGEFGASSMNWIVEMKATGGQPQPLQWEVVALDPTAPGLLRRFVSYFGAVLDDGPEGRRYPGDPPSGFFGVTNLGVDSVAAFTIAEAEARKARVGFDSCDYHLQAREFSNETIWRLELVDGAHRMVGSIFISGTNGAVLRTVWVRRDPVSGYPSITDSLIPGASTAPGPANGLTEIVPGRRPFDSQVMPEITTRPDSAESFRITVEPPADSMTQVDPAASPNAAGQAPQSFSRPLTGGGGSIFRRNNPGRNASPPPAQPPAVIMQPAGPPLPPDLAMPSPTVPVPAPSAEPDLAPLPEPEPIAETPAANPSPGPPIMVPGGEGSSERIPPPPVPQ